MSNYEDLREAIALIEEGLNKISNVVRSEERVLVNTASSRMEFFNPAHECKIMGNVLRDFGKHIEANQLDMAAAMRRHDNGQQH